MDGHSGPVTPDGSEPTPRPGWRPWQGTTEAIGIAIGALCVALAATGIFVAKIAILLILVGSFITFGASLLQQQGTGAGSLRRLRKPFILAAVLLVIGMGLT